jgi:hypothetical protein
MRCTYELPASVAERHSISTAATIVVATAAATTTTTCWPCQHHTCTLEKLSLGSKLTSVTTTAPASAAVTAATTTTVAAHLVQSRINLLLGLLEDTYEITSLLGVCRVC